MAKVYSYTVMMIGLILLLNMSGFTTGSFQLYNAIFGTTGDITQSTAYGKILLIFSLAAVGGIAVSLLTKQSTESIIVAGISGLLFGWIIADLMSVYLVVIDAGYPDFINDVVKLILFPIAAGYFIAIVQWWRGNDI